MCTVVQNHQAYKALNDNTKILTETDTETFFPILNFPKPIPILFFRDQKFWNRNRDFFSDTKFSETKTDTFFLIPNDGADAFESDEEYKETMEYDTDFSDSDSE